MGKNIGDATGYSVLGHQVNIAQGLRSGAIPVESLEVYSMLSKAQHRLLAERKNPFAIPTDPREVWEKIYGDFGLKVDFSGLDFTPPKGGEEYWPALVAQGMMPQSGWDLLLGICPCETQTDLNERIPTNDRTAATKTYIVWMRANVEADPQFANMSGNDLQKKGHKSNTFLERVLLEAYHFTISGGKPLDVKNVTLCAGSRSSGGSIPSVDWHGSQVGLYWYHPGCSLSRLRSREVVSA